MNWKPFSPEMATVDGVLSLRQEPDKQNLLKVLRREIPSRPTLFEFFFNDRLEDQVTRGIEYDRDHMFFPWRRRADAFRLLGYDYVTVGCHVDFPLRQVDQHGAASVSKNEQATIFSMEDAEAYPWPDPDRCEYGMYADVRGRIPDGLPQSVRSLLRIAFQQVRKGIRPISLIAHRSSHIL